MEYQVVQGLPEGNYRIPEYYFVYDNRSKNPKPVDSFVMFCLQKGKLTILENVFEYVQTGDGSMFYYQGGWRQIAVDELSSLYQNISQNEEFKAWQISDYTNELLNAGKDPQVRPVDNGDTVQE